MHVRLFEAGDIGARAAEKLSESEEAATGRCKASLTFGGHAGFCRNGVCCLQVGSKNAAFYLGKRIKVATRQAGGAYVHELGIGASDLEERYRAGEVRPDSSIAKCAGVSANVGMTLDACSRESQGAYSWSAGPNGGGLLLAVASHNAVCLPTGETAVRWCRRGRRPSGCHLSRQPPEMWCAIATE